MSNASAKEKLLTLILCSRNDEYMGNSRWRLQTTLNYVAEQVAALGNLQSVEILVADWGSDVPLQEAILLTPAAEQIVSFVYVPPAIACPLQKDSQFPEVLALNAAARRAKGEYIGRIDQDTLVGRRFFEVFFDLHAGKRRLDVALDTALLYANRRAIPYWFAVRCPGLPHVASFVHRFGCFLGVTRLRNREYWTYYVGIWLIHRRLWIECGGYDERYIYYNWMEVEMISRLLKKYTLVNLGEITDNDFYHLEHLNPRTFTGRQNLGLRSNDHRGLGGEVSAKLDSFHPNSDSWGLLQYDVPLLPGRGGADFGARRGDVFAFAFLAANTGANLLLDTILRTRTKFTRRAAVLRDAISGKPIRRWPALLRGLWLDRRARRQNSLS
jgi:hypothetical protein